MPIQKVEAIIAIGPVVVLGKVGERIEAGYREELNDGCKYGFSEFDPVSEVIEVVTPTTIRLVQIEDGSRLVSGSEEFWTGSSINRSPLRGKFRFFNSGGESNGSSKRRLILFGHVF